MIPLTRRRFIASLAAAPLAVKAFFKPDNLSPLSRLRGKKVSTALYENITTDEARRILLAESAKGKTTMQWWWLHDKDAAEAYEQLLAIEE